MSTKAIAKIFYGIKLQSFLLGLLLFVFSFAHAQVVPVAPAPGATCVVTAQNRTAPMNADGSYALYNLPGNGLIPFGTNASAQPFRVRAVCDDGTVGETPMAFPQFEQTVVLSGDIIWGQNTPKPNRLQLAYPSNTIKVGQTLSPTVAGYYDDGSTKDLTQRATGTGYRSSNTLSVGVTANGDAYVQQLPFWFPPTVVVITAENDGVVTSRVLKPVSNTQLAGTVYKHGGVVPAGGAKVRMVDYAIEVTADASGQYRFDNLPIGIYFTRLIAYEPLSRSYAETQVNLNENTSNQRNIELRGVGTAVVTVVDANDIPLSGVDVVIADSAARFNSDKSILGAAQILKTDAQGLAILEGVAAGSVVPVLGIKGYSSTPVNAILLADGTMNFTVKVTGNSAGGAASLTGVVKDRTGNLGVGVVVKLTETIGLLRSFSFLTGANGKYTFDDLQPSSIYMVSLIKNNIVIGQSSVSTGASGSVTVSNLAFEHVTSISGVVLNNDGVTIAPNLTVQLSRYYFGTWEFVKSVVTDVQGGYQFYPLAPASYRLDAFDGTGQATSAEVIVDSSGTSVIKDIVLGAARQIVTRARLDVRDMDIITNPSLANAQIFVTNSKCVTPCLIGKTVGGVNFDTEILPLGLNVIEARRDGSTAQVTINVDASTDGQIIQNTLLLSVKIHDAVGVLNFASQRSLFSFPALAGDKVDLSVLGYAVSGSSASYATKIELYNSAKQLIASGYGLAPPNLNSSFSGAINSFTLNTDGIYTVVVSPYYTQPKYLGGYLLSLAVNGETTQLLPYSGGGSVEGRVFQKDGVTLAANQLVDLRTLDTLAMHERKTTNSLGQYRFDNVPLADLMVSAIMYEVAQASASGKLDTPAQVLVKDLVMPVARISGILTYQGGMPAQGVTLSIKLKNGLGVRSSKTGSAGYFAFDDLAIGSYDVFDAQGKIIALDVAVLSGADLQVNWSLSTPPSLLIKVKRSNGAPLAGAPVYGYYPNGLLGETNADGLIALDVINCQYYSQYAASYPGKVGFIAVTNTPRPPCNQSQIMEIQFKSVADAQIMVTQNGNTPLAGALILNGQTPLGITNASGIFNIANLVEGSYSLTVQTSNGMAQQINFAVEAASDGKSINRSVDFTTQYDIYGALGIKGIPIFGWRDLYSVPVKRGDTLAIVVHGAVHDGIAAAYNVQADIYSPGKALKASGYGFGAPFQFTQYNISGDLKNITIEEDGYYSIAVKSYYSGNSYAQNNGGYFLSASVNGQLVEIKPYQGGGTVQGTVYHGDGVTPFTNASVELITKDPNGLPIPVGSSFDGIPGELGLHHAVTPDANGHFRFDNVPLADFTVSATNWSPVVALNGTVVVSAADKLDTPAQVLVKDLKMPYTSTLQVSVTVAEYMPIPNAVVISTTDDRGTDNRAVVYFNGNRTSTIANIVTLGDTVTVTATDSQNVNNTVSQTVSGSEAQAVVVNLLLESARVSGTILKADGTPAISSLVTVYRASDRAYVTSTYSDSLGVYALIGLPVGQDLTVAAQNYNNQINSTINLSLSSGQELTGQDITLIATGSIEGYVKVASGTPIPDVSFTVRGTLNGLAFNIPGGATDQNGFYHIDNVPVGADVQVTVTTPGPFGSTQTQTTRVDLLNQLVTLPDFTFTSGATLQINVLDGNHQQNPLVLFAGNGECGLNKIHLTASSTDLWINANQNLGAFDLLSDIPEGQAVVSLYDGCASEWDPAEVPLASASITIVANQPNQMELIVPIVRGRISVTGGMPIDFFAETPRITQVRPGGSITTRYAAGVDNGSLAPGEYVILGVAPGDFTIDVSAYYINASSQYEYLTGTKSGTMVGTATKYFDVELLFNYTGPAKLVGVVRFSDGVPVAGADVSLFQNGLTVHATTDPAGYYQFDSPVVGAFDIAAQDSATGLSASASGFVVDGAVTTVDLSMLFTGSVTGILYNSNGIPIVNTDVDVFTSGAPDLDLYVTTDAQGRYRADHVPLGDITVVGWNDDTQTVLVGYGKLTTDKETITVDLHEAVGGVVNGRVLADISGTPVPNAGVTLVTTASYGPYGPMQQYVAADASGMFNFATAPAGGFRLYASDPIDSAKVGYSDGTAIMNTVVSLDVTLGNAAGFPFTLTGSDGYKYNVQGNGSLWNYEAPYINNGYALKVNNAYFPWLPGASVSSDKRELIFGPAMMGPVQVTRRVFSPVSGGFIRFIDTYANPGGVDANISVQVGLSNLGYYAPLLVNPVTNNQTYAVLGDPALANVFGGTGSSNPSGTFRYTPISYTFNNVQVNYDTMVSYNWMLTVPAGQRISLMHFSAQAASGAAAQTVGDSLSTYAAPFMFEGISTIDIPFVYNFPYFND